MKYAVSDEGVAALQMLSNSITGAIGDIFQFTANVQSAMDEHSDTIGPHRTSLNAAIMDIYQSIRTSVEPANSLSEMLKEVAEAYQEIIDNDRIKSGSAGSDSKESIGDGQSKKGSFSGGVFGGKEETQSTQMFGQFETGKYENGDSVVKGDNFEQYMSDYYDYESSTYESLGDNSIVETIPPSKIEGIHIGSTEMEDNGRFWSQHKSDGTADSFTEIASHIPEVKSQIDAGKSLSEIKENSDLAECVDIYFDPSNIPRVVKSNGYYEFDSNGRHRILAARELGYDIPVKIIGIRRRK